MTSLDPDSRGMGSAARLYGSKCNGASFYCPIVLSAPFGLVEVKRIGPTGKTAGDQTGRPWPAPRQRPREELAFPTGTLAVGGCRGGEAARNLRDSFQASHGRKAQVICHFCHLFDRVRLIIV